MELAGLAATAAQALLASGDISVETYARALLEHVAASEPALQAWSFLDPDHVISAARALDRAGPGGALFGLPVGLKDVFLTADMPTQYNADIYRGLRPGMDAAAVGMLRAQSALLLGKTQTVEFGATGRVAPTRNPHDHARTPGGSSSGSAAAVASGHVPLALGTQTAGSIIRPASFCGVFGMKPSWGLISRDGARAFAPTLDTIGWFARSVADLALMYRALVQDRRAPGIPLQPHIAICQPPGWDRADGATVAALAAAERQLDAAGCRQTRLDLPLPFTSLIDLQTEIMRREGGRSFQAEHAADAHALHPNLCAMVEYAGSADPAELARAYDHAAWCRASFDVLARSFDGVLCPSAIGEAPVGLGDTGDYRFNGIWTLLHTPCINLPYWHGPHGMPIGLTLTGPRFSDPVLLATAARLQRIFVA